MKPFRFRAQAALDLRQRVETEARKALVTAEEHARLANVRLNEAAHSVGVAQETLTCAERDGVSGAELRWHQSWIARQRLEVDARRREAAVSAASVDRAVTSVRAAHKQRRTLERLRDRLLMRHRIEARRHEQRNLDELAGLRFTARAPKGNT